METVAQMDTHERNARHIGALCATNPQISKKHLEEYVRDGGPVVPLYTFLPLSMLEENGLVDSSTIKALTRVNTRRFFVQNRVFFVDQDIGAYGLLYAVLASPSCSRNPRRLVRSLLRIIDPLKAIDILSEVLMLPTLPFTYEKIVELFHVLALNKPKMSQTFMSNAFLLRNDHLTLFVLKKLNYSKEAFKVLVDADYDFCRNNFKNFCTNRDMLRVFLKRAPVLSDYEAYVDAEVVLDNFEKLSLKEVLRYAKLFAKRSIVVAYWKVLSRENATRRFAHYEKLDKSGEVFDNTRKLIKRLSLGNVELIYSKMEDLIYESPTSYFEAVMETVFSYDALLSVLERVLVLLPPIFIDVLYFCILRAFVTRTDFVVQGSYVKWYLNLCMLFKMISTSVQLEATYTVLIKFFDTHRFAHLPLLEAIVSKYGEMHEKVHSLHTVRGLAIPDALVVHVKRAVNDVFVSENFPLGFKIDLSERYRRMCEMLGGAVLYSVLLKFDTLRYYTPNELRKGAGSINAVGLNEIVCAYKKHYAQHMRLWEAESTANTCGANGDEWVDFFLVKNFILLVNIRHKDIEDIDWTMEHLGHMKGTGREDLKVLSESCLANILVEERSFKRPKTGKEPLQKLQDLEIRKKQPEHPLSADDATKKHRSSARSVEEGEILEE